MLQVFDESGTLIFDQNSELVKILGFYTIDGNSPANGAISDPRFTAYSQHIGFWARVDGGFDNIQDATWTLDGNNLKWSYPSSARPGQRIVYGIM